MNNCVLCGISINSNEGTCFDCKEEWSIKVGDKVFDCMYQDPKKYPIRSIYTVLNVIARKDTHLMEDPIIIRIDHEFDDGYRESLLVHKLIPKKWRKT